MTLGLALTVVPTYASPPAVEDATTLIEEWVEEIVDEIATLLGEGADTSADPADDELGTTINPDG